MEELRNLNDLNQGLQKQWIWGNNDNFNRSCDYLQKINYSIQDLNAEIKNLSNPTMKEVVFIIVLIDWIYEAVNSLQKILLSDIRDCFTYINDKEVKKAEKYLKAMRSFVVAHPLNTTRHKDYGLDGDMICVDIRTKTSMHTSTCPHNSEWFYLGIDGLQENAKDKSSDFVLCVYSKKAMEWNFLNLYKLIFLIYIVLQNC